MSKTLDKEILERMLKNAVAVLEQNRDHLNQLDAATGDGDHGTSILRAMRAAAGAASGEGSFKDVVFNVGFAAESEDCGSTSSLTGSLYQGMSEAVDAEEMNADGVVEMYVAGLACVGKSTKAQVGDKTLMDALIPAVEAMKSHKGNDVTIIELFDSAAKAAQTGAESTKEMVAKFGRAKNLGTRVIGHIDAGATSTAMILKAFVDSFES